MMWLPQASEASTIESRLTRRVSYIEAFALLFGICLSIGLATFNVSNPAIGGSDFFIYLNAANGEFEGFYYAYWSLPIFDLLNRLPSPQIAYALWNTLNILCCFLAARILGGKASVVLLSYQMFFILYYGQISGVIVLGIAWYSWMLARSRPLLAGWGAVLAFIKPQMGFPMILAAALVADIRWRDRVVSSIPSFAVLLLSLLAYDGWIIELVERIRTQPPIVVGSIPLWDYIGAWSLLLWLPVLLLPLKPTQRLIAVAAVSSLAVPYFQHTGLITLFVLPVGYLGLLGNLGYLMIPLRWDGLETLLIVPLLAYLGVILPPLWKLIQARFAARYLTPSQN